MVLSFSVLYSSPQVLSFVVCSSILFYCIEIVHAFFLGTLDSPYTLPTAHVREPKSSRAKGHPNIAEELAWNFPMLLSGADLLFLALRCLCELLFE